MTLEDRPPICDMPPPQWGNRQLRRLGEAIRDDVDAPAGGPSYGDVMLWYDELAAAVQAALRELDWISLLAERPPPEISSRAKTIDTLRDKLRRDHRTPLSSIQDVAGVRFECEMTLEEQDVVALAIAQAFGQDVTAIHDIRASPRCGYRAVHVWLRLARGRVEVQVRTHMQGAWANAYEALADALGRGIRYGEPPNVDVREAHDMVHRLQEISTDNVARLEGRRQQLATLQLQMGLTDGVLESRQSPVSHAVSDSIATAWQDLRRDEQLVMEMLRGVEEIMRSVRR